MTNDQACNLSIHDLTRVMKLERGSTMVLNGKTTPDNTPFVVVIARANRGNEPVIQALGELVAVIEQNATLLKHDDYRVRW